MIEERIIIGQGSKYPLNGIITLPETDSNDIPAVVLVQGSGSTDMDSKVFALTPFKDIAGQLAEKGVASIRYDKRSKAHPFKMIKDPDGLTIREETIYDAVLAADMLRAHPRIGKIYVFGHSQGAMQAGRIDAEGGNFDGLILAAGSTRTLREIMNDQIKEELFGRKGLIKKFADWQTAKMMAKLEGIENLTDEEAKEKKLFGGTTAYYFLEMEKNPPSKYLEGLDKPVFVIHGDKDFQVSVEKDFEGFKEALRDNPQASFKIYPGLNHVFTTSVATGTIKDYKVPGTVDMRVTNDIADWIHALK
jgi:pimeloyl-ACP methyl ester carboxylesterase